MIVTIDGTAGSGKSTAAARLADRLDALHLDTGTMYRAVTLAALRAGTDLEDAEALERVAREARIDLVEEGGRTRVRLNGDDVTDAIRENRVSTNAHYAARTPGVREVLVARQREYRERADRLVAEGRDQGTVVFPDADVKFYLDADAAERARRRQLELQQRGEVRSYRQVLAEVRKRDERDATRAIGPLRPADDAVHVDTTDLGIEEMVEVLLAEVRRRTGGTA
jgi:cytidylate kinase